MSSRGSATYSVAKVIAMVLKPLVGKSPHHIQSNSDFVNRVKKVTLLPGECLSSYDVISLFTLVSLDPALNIIKDLLEHDETLSNRTVLSVQHIIELLGSVCIILASLFKIGSMNKWKAWLWGHW